MEKHLKQPPSAETLQEVFDVHLDYEITRLVQQYLLLSNRQTYCTGLSPEAADAIDDGLLVSFCTHARNLLEFFYRSPDQNHYYAVSTDYAKPGYEKLDLDNDRDAQRLRRQLNAQINHLTYKRTDAAHEKIQPSQRKELIELIQREAARLAGQLKTGFDERHLHLDLLGGATTGNKTSTASPGLTVERRFLITEPQVVNSTAPGDVGATFRELIKK